ncbi:MAG: hypothetical protein P8J43_08655 [Pirellulales bacterium]|nr:hypothetical protein [Pirellulales bacterium]
MRSIDGKSFSIGVLSAITVCLAMGTTMQTATVTVVRRHYEGEVAIEGTPFAVEDGKIYYFN